MLIVTRNILLIFKIYTELNKMNVVRKLHERIGGGWGEVIYHFSLFQRANTTADDPDDPHPDQLKVAVIEAAIKSGVDLSNFEDELNGILKLSENKPGLLGNTINKITNLLSKETQVTDMFNDEKPRPISEQEFDEILSDTDLAIEYKAMKEDKCGIPTLHFNNAITTLNSHQTTLSEIQYSDDDIRQFTDGINKTREQIKIAEDILRSIRSTISDKEEYLLYDEEDGVVDTFYTSGNRRIESGCPSTYFVSDDNNKKFEKKLKKIGKLP